MNRIIDILNDKHYFVKKGKGGLFYRPPRKMIGRGYEEDLALIEKDPKLEAAVSALPFITVKEEGKDVTYTPEQINKFAEEQTRNPTYNAKQFKKLFKDDKSDYIQKYRNKYPDYEAAKYKLDEIPMLKKNIAIQRTRERRAEAKERGAMGQEERISRKRAEIERAAKELVARAATKIQSRQRIIQAKQKVEKIKWKEIINKTLMDNNITSKAGIESAINKFIEEQNFIQDLQTEIAKLTEERQEYINSLAKVYMKRRDEYKHKLRTEEFIKRLKEGKYKDQTEKIKQIETKLKEKDKIIADLQTKKLLTGKRLYDILLPEIFNQEMMYPLPLKTVKAGNEIIEKMGGFRRIDLPTNIRGTQEDVQEINNYEGQMFDPEFTPLDTMKHFSSRVVEAEAAQKYCDENNFIMKLNPKTKKVDNSTYLEFALCGPNNPNAYQIYSIPTNFHNSDIILRDMIDIINQSRPSKNKVKSLGSQFIVDNIDFNNLIFNELKNYENISYENYYNMNLAFKKIFYEKLKERLDDQIGIYDRSTPQKQVELKKIIDDFRDILTNKTKFEKKFYRECKYYGVGITINKFNKIDTEILTPEFYRNAPDYNPEDPNYNKKLIQKVISKQGQKFSITTENKYITGLRQNENEKIKGEINNMFAEWFKGGKKYNYNITTRFSNVTGIYDYTNDNYVENENILATYQTCYTSDWRDNFEDYKGVLIPIEKFTVLKAPIKVRAKKLTTIKPKKGRKKSNVI